MRYQYKIFPSCRTLKSKGDSFYKTSYVHNSLVSSKSIKRQLSEPKAFGVWFRGDIFSEFKTSCRWQIVVFVGRRELIWPAVRSGRVMGQFRIHCLTFISLLRPRELGIVFLKQHRSARDMGNRTLRLESTLVRILRNIRGVYFYMRLTTIDTYQSSVSQSLNPFANGLLAIFNWVICGCNLLTYIIAAVVNQQTYVSTLTDYEVIPLVCINIQI